MREQELSETKMDTTAVQPGVYKEPNTTAKPLYINNELPERNKVTSDLVLIQLLGDIVVELKDMNQKLSKILPKAGRMAAND